MRGPKRHAKSENQLREWLDAWPPEDSSESTVRLIFELMLYGRSEAFPDGVALQWIYLRDQFQDLRSELKVKGRWLKDRVEVTVGRLVDIANTKLTADKDDGVGLLALQLVELVSCAKVDDPRASPANPDNPGWNPDTVETIRKLSAHVWHNRSMTVDVTQAWHNIVLGVLASAVRFFILTRALNTYQDAARNDANLRSTLDQFHWALPPPRGEPPKRNASIWRNGIWWKECHQLHFVFSQQAVMSWILGNFVRRRGDQSIYQEPYIIPVDLVKKPLHGERMTLLKLKADLHGHEGEEWPLIMALLQNALQPGYDPRPQMHGELTAICEHDEDGHPFSFLWPNEKDPNKTTVETKSLAQRFQKLLQYLQDDTISPRDVAGRHFKRYFDTDSMLNVTLNTWPDWIDFDMYVLIQAIACLESLGILQRGNVAARQEATVVLDQLGNPNLWETTWPQWWYNALKIRPPHSSFIERGVISGSVKQRASRLSHLSAPPAARQRRHSYHPGGADRVVAYRRRS